jgi:transcriptional regulator with XRE-family HTH domain
MKLAHNLKKIMKTNGYSLSKLAMELKIPKSTIHGWLNGVEPKSIIELKRLSDHLSIQLDDLCFGEGQKEVFKKTNIKIVIDDQQFELILKQ